MNRKRICGLISGIFIMMLFSGWGGEDKSASKAAAQTQQVPQQTALADNPEMFMVANGKTGLFHTQLTVAEAKAMITGTYGGRFSEDNEAGGEGTTVQVINAFINTADNLPSLKIILDSTGKIYQIFTLAPEFNTMTGLHVGSTWAEIRKVYPNAKITFEGVVAFHTPDHSVVCEIDAKAPANWENIRTGKEVPPDDLKVVRMFTN